jgi:ATP-dependent HslUV protease ATP-binding subunit HslU
MGVEIMTPPGMEEMANQLQGLFQNLGQNQKKKRKIKVKEAMKALIEEEAARLVNPEELKQKAIASVENNGIVFLDEIDKICKRGESSGPVPVKGAARPAAAGRGLHRQHQARHGQDRSTSCLSPPAPSRSPSRPTSSPSCRAACRSGSS